jgi:S-adenosylmethionine hydrolase
MTPPIALLTDFGLDDWYVGVMKGVILSINPDVRIIDVTHSVPPQDIEAANFALLASYKYLPAGSVVVVVVDPGVGGKRGILVARSGGRRFVFPDNGALTGLLDRDGFEKLVRVETREFLLEPVSSTFHGRDIFAPVAAHLSLGLPLDSLGPKVDSFERMEIPGPQIGEDRVIARIRWIDRFGNLITDCPAGLVEETSKSWDGVAVDLGSHGNAPVVAAYEDVECGRPLGIIGSSGYLEVSVREGNAARLLDLELGGTITLRKP